VDDVQDAAAPDGVRDGREVRGVVVGVRIPVGASRGSGTPVFRRFEGDRSEAGEFHGDDTYDGKDVGVRFVWSGISPTSTAGNRFSTDDLRGGDTWLTNWATEFTRA
jgi:hypothetical protein